MTDEPKACPLCGQPAHYYDYGDDRDAWGCSNPVCPIYYHFVVVPLAVWNGRPIEDAQQARIDETADGTPRPEQGEVRRLGHLFRR